MKNSTTTRFAVACLLAITALNGFAQLPDYIIRVTYDGQIVLDRVEVLVFDNVRACSLLNESRMQPPSDDAAWTSLEILPDAAGNFPDRALNVPPGLQFQYAVARGEPTGPSGGGSGYFATFGCIDEIPAPESSGGTRIEIAMHDIVDLSYGLVAYYPYDGDAADQSGNSNHGIEFGGVAFGAGLGPGQSLSLDGVDDFVQLPRVVETDFTVSFWVNTRAIAPVGTFWFEGLGLVDGEVCGSPPGGDWGIALLSGGHVSYVDSVSSSQVNDGVWHSVVVTRDTMQGEVVIYVDGVPEAVGAGGSTPLTAPPWLGVGNNPCDVSFARRYFPGRIDELRFYDRVVTEDEIRELADDGVFADGFE